MALNVLITEEHQLFYIPLYKFLHNLVNAMLEILNNVDLQEIKYIWG
jgi:hypothetical protein